MNDRSLKIAGPVVLLGAALSACSDTDDMPPTPLEPTIEPILLELPVRVTSGSSGLLQSIFADVDGDSLADLVEIDVSDNELRVARGDTSTIFLAPQVLSTAGFPLTVAGGDFDADGRDELMVVSVLDPNFEAYTIQGMSDDMGSFAGANAVLTLYDRPDGGGDLVEIASENLPGAALQITAGNFGQAEDTLIVPLPSEQAVWLYRVDGDGLLVRDVIESIGEFEEGTPVTALSVDVDGDGQEDLLVGEANYNGDGPGSVAVFVQDDEGSFSGPSYPLTSPSLPLLARVADVDDDGVGDVAALDVRGGADSMVLYGTNSGAIADLGVFTVGGRSTGAGVGDFDGDGALELVVSLLEEGELVTLPLTGFVGSEPLPAPLELGIVPRGMQVVDLDGDPFADLAVHHATGTTLMAGSAEGLRGIPGYQVPESSQFLRSTDLDGDGFGDVVTLDLFQRELTFLRGGADGSLTFVDGVPLEPTASQTPGSFEFGDLDGDGDQDVVIALFEANELRLFENDGQLPFGTTKSALPVGGGPLGLAAADMDDDGVLDLVVGNSEDNTIQILKGDGDLNFEIVSTSSVGARPLALEVADLDGDGDLDVAVTADAGSGASPRVLVLEHGDDFSLTVRSVLSLPTPATEIEAADLDGDGALELVINQPGVDSRSLLVADAADGALDSYVLQEIEVLLDTQFDFDPATFVLADVDDDGLLDILVLASSGRPVLLINAGGLEFSIAALPGAGNASPAAPFGVRHSRIADIDGDGRPELLLLTPKRPRLWVVSGLNAEGQ